jgi:hypothetical protein
LPCGRRNAALFVQIKTLERLQETIGQKLSNHHSAPFLALFRVAGRQKDALAGNGVLEQRHEPSEHNADHDLQQVNQPPGPLITNWLQLECGIRSRSGWQNPVRSPG